MSDELPAGRELDAIVAEKVMGWNFTTRMAYSTDQDAALELFNHFPCPRSLRCDAEGIWWAEYNLDGTRYVGRGETAELAICRGALKVVESGPIEPPARN